MTSKRAAIVCLGLLTIPEGPPLVGQQRLDIEELASTRGDPASPFGVVGDIVAVAGGRAVISDDVLQELRVWAPGTARVRRLARAGDGPGEVKTPTRLARRPQGGFALYDAGHAAVMLFDESLTFERAVRVGLISNPKGIAVLRDGSFVIAGARLTDPRHLHKFTDDGRRVEAFGDPPAGITSEYARIQAAGGAIRATSNDGILFSYGAPLRISRFGEGSLKDPVVLYEDKAVLADLTEETLYRPDPEGHGDGRVFQWWHDRSTGVFALPDGNILNVITRFHRGDSVWHLISPRGQLIATRTVPRAYYAHDITSDGRIFASYRTPNTDEHIAVLLELRVG